MEIVVSALIAAVISGIGLYYNRRWRLNQEARAENLSNYRMLKTLGFLQVQGLERLSGLVEGEEGEKKLREALLAAGTAIYEMDLIASPLVLRRFVGFFREVDAFHKRLEQLAAEGEEAHAAGV
jgi:hypothetical protein